MVDNERHEVILAINTWTATLLNVEIAKQVIEANFPHISVRVEKYGATMDTVNYMLQNPEKPIVFFELWPSAVAGTLADIRKAVEYGLSTKEIGVVELGELGVNGNNGFYVPSYVVERYPNASSWKFYQHADTAQLFETPETAPCGRLLTGDPTWSNLECAIIRNLKLPFGVVYAGNETAQIEILHEAVSKEEPVLMYWWEPTPVATRYNLTKVALPKITEECLAALEYSYEFFYSCEYPRDVTIKLITHGVEENTPDLVPFLKAFTITNDDQLSLLPLVMFDGESVDTVSADWIEINKDRVDAWLVPSYIEIVDTSKAVAEEMIETSTSTASATAVGESYPFLFISAFLAMVLFKM